ncbi:senecionine N-oxygenase-like [Macrosteles quadrilineatus]|uniref:senecionine N-oxygenase-like n=1 Tax=Macrosteles quadrilineatus TaxID=74068 RepID=UPI0023E24F6D|nr:senecionine N-oxygenase-like [Macrosteles quadrilineatus]
MAMRVGVVGAGPAGLCAARHCLANGMSCTVFEQTNDVGGTWQYTESVGKDQYGIPIHTSMYRDLRTNVPKDVVKFPELDHKETAESYLTSPEILQYLKDYTEMFNIRSVCKFNHHVKKMSFKDGKWRVTVVDLPNQQENTYTFDALFICNGLNNTPFYPKVEGAEQFQGTLIHSHDYRVPEQFSDQNVVIIGGGASGLDLTNHISKCAAKVFLSHRSDRFDEKNVTLLDNVIFKTDVVSLTEDSAVFGDGTVERVDAVIYCTGFKCNYTFMDESCGIREDDGLVYPLYKYFINANNPTMCILGNLCMSMQFPTFDIQVRFFVKTLQDSSILPSREGMFRDIEEHARRKLVDPEIPKKMYFKTTVDEDAQYYDNLAKMADIEPLPKVLIEIFARAVAQIYGNFPLFREDKYKIIDDKTYAVFPPSA